MLAVTKLLSFFVVHAPNFMKLGHLDHHGQASIQKQNIFSDDKRSSL
jgi:hypothetical protein